MSDVEIIAEPPWGKATPELLAQLRRDALAAAEAELRQFVYGNCAQILSAPAAAAALERTMAEVERRLDQSVAQALAAHAIRKASDQST